MTAWLRLLCQQGRGQRYCIESHPSPTIAASGISICSPTQYTLEEDGEPFSMPAESKPPYRVPSLDEIRQLPWNGYRVVSTFSGCGGSCLGYRMAGFRVVWANEFIPAARQSYKANADPECVLDGRDIRVIQPTEILQATGLREGELDLFDGSPPCASFSMAGKRHKDWGKAKKYSQTVQRTDDLFFEYARLLRGLRPKVFVAENVSGLVKGTAKGFFLEILQTLKECGYRVSCRVLDAQWLGVPQMRARTIFVGVRDDLGIDPVHPAPLPYRYSIRDAIPWILREHYDSKGQFPKVDRPAEKPSLTITVENVKDLTVEAESDISRFAIGQEWDKLQPGQSSEKYFNLCRPDAEKPCPAICATHGNSSTAGVTHPSERRKFSIAELKRICAFPDDFVLVGSYYQQWERLGRSVPPLMMRAVAAVIRDEILAKVG